MKSLETVGNHHSLTCSIARLCHAYITLGSGIVTNDLELYINVKYRQTDIRRRCAINGTVQSGTLQEKLKSSRLKGQLLHLGCWGGLK